MLDLRDLEIARLRIALAEANEALAREADARRRFEELQHTLDLSARAAIDSIPGFVGILAPDGSVEVVNRQVMEYCGATLEDLRKWSLSGIVHPDDLSRNVEVFSEAIAAGVPYDHEIRLRRFDGAFRWFSNRGIPIKDDAGKVLRWYVLLTDIDDLKRTEATLKDNETKLKQALAQQNEAQRLSKTGSYTTDMLKDERIWSDELYRIFDFEPGTKVTAQMMLNRIHPEDLPAFQVAFKRALGGVSTPGFLFRIVVPNGELKWLRTLLKFEPKIEGGFEVTGAIQDVTENKLAEIALKESETELRHLLAHLNEAQRLSKTGSFIADMASERHWSDEAYRLFEFEPGSKVTLQHIRDAVHPDDRAMIDRVFEQAAPGRDADFTFRIITVGGALKHVHGVAHVLEEVGGRPSFVGALQDVTENKLAEIALKKNGEELRRAMSHLAEAQRLSKTGSFTADFERDEHFWSEELYRICDFEPGSKITLQRFLDRVYPEDQRAFQATIQDGLTGVEVADVSFRFVTPTALKHLHFVAKRVTELEDRSVFVGAVQDVTETALAKEGLAASERNLRQTIDTIPGMVAVFSTDGETQFVNQQALDYFGATREDIRGWESGAYTHPEDNARSRETFRRAIVSGEPFEMEIRARRSDGTYRWFQSRGHPLRDISGRIVRWYNLLTDIDDGKRAEDELQRAYNSFADAQRLSKTGSFIADLAADEFVCSDEAYRIFEFELGGKVTIGRILDAVHPDDRGRFGAARDRAAAGIAGDDFLFRIVTASGNLKYVRTLAHIVEGVAGRPSLVGAVQDVTESKLAENALRRSEAFLAHGEAVSETGSFLWNLEIDEILWSKQLYRIFDFEPDSLVTLDRIVERVHVQDAPLMTDMVARAHAGLDSEYEHRLQMPDGTIKYLHFVGQSTRGPEGRLEYMGSVQNITNRKLAEQEHDRVRAELTHAARVMSLGVLTASLAHEVNQPLAGIVMNANTCARMLSGDPPNVEGALETVRRTIRDGRRASEVVKRLRGLFSKREFVVEPVDLNDAAREVLVLSANEMRRQRVTVLSEFANGTIEVTGDRVQIQQVILNLVLNACDAVKEVEGGARIVTVRTGKDGAGSGCVTVRDTGVGIAADSLDRVFDTFYTTKSQGMGIGLSISRSIIERHHGRLWAEANEGPGATFSFSIPLNAGSPITTSVS